MSDRFISVSEAAGELGISPRRIRQLIEEKELRAHRIGNSWAIPVGEIHQRQRLSPRAGRPYEQENIWKLSALADAIAHNFIVEAGKGGSWKERALSEQDRAAEQLGNSIKEICSFEIGDVIDDPSRLAELGRLLSNAQSLSRRDEILVGWLDEAARYLLELEARAQVDPHLLSREWRHILGVEEDDAAQEARLLRSLRNMSMRRYGDLQRNVASLKSRFDQVIFFHAHPSVLVDLVRDSRVIHSGAHAAARYGVDLVPGDRVDAYISDRHASSLVDHYSLLEADSQSGNVILRLVSASPDHHPPVAPRLCVAVDLLEEMDPRSQSAGSQLLDALLAAISLDQLLSRWKSNFPR